MTEESSSRSAGDGHAAAPDFLVVTGYSLTTVWFAHEQKKSGAAR